MHGLLAVLDAFGIPTTWDVFLVVGLFVASVIYGMAVGRDRAVLILLSTYIALAVVTNAPIVSFLNRTFNTYGSPTIQLVWFLGLFASIFFLLWKSHVLRGMAKSRGSWWEAVLFSLLQVGLAASVALFLLPTEMTDPIQGVLRDLFLDIGARSFWLIAPIVFLAWLGRELPADDD